MPPPTALNTWDKIFTAIQGGGANVGVVYVNSFGAVGDNTSHPLSETYGTLAAAQVDYPAATDLSDEKDWCAWQAASNYIYDQADSVLEVSNWSCGHIMAHGQYVVNKTVVFNHSVIEVEGAVQGARTPRHGQQGTSVSYNGPNGTVDDPIPIFDFYLFKENGDPPPGRKGNATLSGGIKAVVENIIFCGKGGNVITGDLDVSGFISAVRIRKAAFTKIVNCTFVDCLYDAIYTTDAQLFLELRNNFFYGVHRDAISGQSVRNNFSTTVWIYNNEFGLVGRYSMLLDLSGSVEAFPIIRDNSAEHFCNSYFVRNPEWFVQGLIAGSCFINCGNMLFEGNRFEGVADVNATCYADVHLLNSVGVLIQSSTVRNLACTAKSVAAARTAAAATYLDAHLHLDITDQRNYNIGLASEDVVESSGLTVRHVYNLTKIFVVDGKGLSTSATHIFEDVQFAILSIPTVVGTYATLVQPRPSALVTLCDETENFSLRNVSIADTSGYRIYQNFHQSRKHGDYRLRSGPAVFGQWAALTAYVKTMTNESMNSLRAPITENGFFYQCVVAGTSGASEPTWPTTIGNTVVDGTVTWKCVGRCAYVAEDQASEWQAAGQRHRLQAAAPITGLWAIGDRVLFPAPSAGGFMGKVCTAAGTPGTWKDFGAIAA